jgi:hypothetical protein
LTVQIQVNGQTEILQDPDEIAHSIKTHNKKHFSQARGRFFNQDSTLNLDDANMIKLNPDLHQIQEFKLIFIMQDMIPDTISSDISLQDWETKFWKWRESTRTSPSEVHLGHYKSLLKPVMEGTTRIWR